jgi:hypothetical protein
LKARLVSTQSLEARLVSTTHNLQARLVSTTHNLKARLVSTTHSLKARLVSTLEVPWKSDFTVFQAFAFSNGSACGAATLRTC